MKLLEYQAKEFFFRAGIPVPREKLVLSPKEALSAAGELGLPCVLKAQVGVGGRGKAGGVKLAKTEGEVKAHAGNIIGMDIKGEKVERLLCSEAVDIAEEYYTSITNDRANRALVLMVSPAGGVDIEQVASETPERILKLQIDPLMGLQAYQQRRAGAFLSEAKDVRKQIAAIIGKLYWMYVCNDLSLAEINPLVVTGEGKVIALDAKVIVDDNAMFRHPDFADYRILSEDEAVEHEAKGKGLSYIKLSGKVGCIVNGAGLAMATMDLIKRYGGEPANFLDVGGSSSPEKMLSAIDYVTSDKNVRSIFVNIFGGITRCDDIARGLLAATKDNPLPVPVVVRLTGTNEDEARELLEGTSFIPATDMADGAKKAIEAAGDG
ncbi:ADP-forming succinate--CoA ligase subunit beta [candidate division WOR-3 bacterium]|uniref:Succinate--CoA ligase [ADP-forming] subunit beta n=1 Tax=candidate division WOR-3 bacterium TaxID=2052148 RepID=A0A9D5QC35_UNCW3|nr:ADP-forming succinate--CoA ligase subunit beta [candidate division WOR-3 bacterium]MBD3364258.1 ADP-forming succinate--CoA ligase subunit beta [candidate division WOR-3 bacterium]